MRPGEAHPEQYNIYGRGQTQQARDVWLEDPRPRLHKTRSHNILTESIKVRQVAPVTS